MLLWADWVAELLTVDPLLSVWTATGFDAVDAGATVPNVFTVCEVDSEETSLELSVLDACSAERLLADATDAADTEEADSSLM